MNHQVAIMNDFPVNEHGIAVIGMVCRVPGATNIDAFWQNLRDGVESISFFGREELLAAGCDPALIDQPNYVPASAVLDHPDQFAADFFGYTPREAELIDPQQRLFLESAVEALEMAGYGAEAYRNPVGVFAGAGMNMYLLNQLAHDEHHFASADYMQLSLGNEKDFLPTRISYKLNLSGPSINIQTACSTSLVAVHLACQSLLEGECRMALAGGVSLHFPQVGGYLHQPNMIFSADGHCRAFSADATGTIGGSGVAIVVLKRLVDAVQDGDTIYAVIKGSAVNNDGAAKIGFTAPSIEGQAAVITEALAIADVDPETITYVEAHGTGTELGDPIEIAALTQAFHTQGAQQRHFCAIGSLKTNVGHMDAAAGAGGLIKTVLALYHKLIPPSLHFTAPNPQIDFVNSPFYVNTRLTKWPNSGTPRRAGVTSLGLGGTNAHVIVEEAPLLPASGSTRTWQLLLLSAKTAEALDCATSNLANHLQPHADLNLADVAYTLQVGRQPFAHRRMVVCQDIPTAIDALTAENAATSITAVTPEVSPSVVFMFPGGGAQYVNMGHDLYQTESVFRQTVDHCVEILLPHLGVDLRRLLYQPIDPVRSAEQMRQPSIALSALFVTEYALAQLWMAWGIQPTAMIGHSLGEYTAACLAGVFTLEDALALVSYRGRLMDTMPAGIMLSIALSEAEVRALLAATGSELDIAAINTPSSCVVSGGKTAIDQWTMQLDAKSIQYQPLQIAVAAHCTQVEPILDAFRMFVASLPLQPPHLSFISNLSGTWITAQEATDPDYWVRHLRHSVRFTDGIATLLQTPDRILLEVGPGRTLASLARQHPARHGQVILTSLRHPQEQQSDVAFVLHTLGRLWLAGATVDWLGFYADEMRHRLPLPTYPFQRKRYWVEPQPRRTAHDTTAKKREIDDWFYLPMWKQSPQAALLPQRAEADTPQYWLVFLDPCGLASQLATGMAAEGRTIITVESGAAFARLDEDRFVINPYQRADYFALLGELASWRQYPVEILHAWSVTPVDDASATDAFERTARAQTLGFDSLLYLTQALDTQGWHAPLTITVMSTNMHKLGDETQFYPEKILVLGPVKVIPLEHRSITCRSIDVSLAEPNTPQATMLVDQLLAELRSAPTEQVVAYRASQRWLQIFEPVRLAPKPGKQRLRSQGVYLITGGLGGVGLALAEYLATQVQARLILVGRTSLPARTVWEQWLVEHGTDDDISQKIRKIQTMERLGAEILVLSADVTSQVRMAEVVAQARLRFGAIHGVIHAAVTIEAGIIIHKTPETVARALAAKVQGTLVLDALFAQYPLDFMVYCASLSGISAAFGHVEYTAANLFQDAYAHYRTAKRGQCTLSIDWDLWQQTGAVIAAEQMYESLTGEKLLGMTPDEGVQAFQRVIEHRLPPQVLVSIQTIDTLLKENTQQEMLSQTPTALRRSTHSRPHLSTPFVAPQTKTEQALTVIFEQLLGIVDIGTHDDFFELGGHSLLAAQLTARIRAVFDVDLSLGVLFANPTISSLAEWIVVVKTQEKAACPESQASLQPVARNQPLPLSFYQEDAWLLSQSSTVATLHQYNLVYSYRLIGKLDVNALRQSFNTLIQRHEILRTIYRRVNGEAAATPSLSAMQSIVPEAAIDPALLDLRGQTEAAQSREIERLIEREQQSLLDLTKAPALRVTVVCLNSESHLLVITIHHISIDDWSTGILLNELTILYRAFVMQESVSLPLLPIQYADFADWQRRFYTPTILAERQQYWQQLLTTPPAPLLLPLDRPRPAVETTRTYSAGNEPIALSPTLTQALKELGQRQRASLPMLLLAGYTTVLYRYSGCADILLGAPTNRRHQPEFQSLIGYMAGMSLLRFDLSGAPTFRELIQRVKQTLQMALDKQDITLRQLLRLTEPGWLPTGFPDFQATFNFLPATDVAEIKLPELTLTPVDLLSPLIFRDLAFRVWEEPGKGAGEKLCGHWSYRQDLFDPSTIKQMIEDLQTVLEAIIADPTQSIDQIVLRQEHHEHTLA